MKAPRQGSTPKQVAYAMRLFGGQGGSKKEIALSAGYSEYSAKTTASKIENREGFHVAIQKLATDSNNLALAALFELKHRGFDTFTNKELLQSIEVIGKSWDRYNRFNMPEKEKKGQGENRLRTVMIARTDTNGKMKLSPVIDIQDKKTIKEEIEVQEFKEEESDIEYEVENKEEENDDPNDF